MYIKNIFTLIILAIIPALVIEISYILFINITDGFGLPNINALAFAVLFPMLPLMLFIILFYSKKEFGYLSLKKTINYNKHIDKKTFILYSAFLLGFGFLVFTLGKPLDKIIYENVFSFIPSKYILNVTPENLTIAQSSITLFSAIFVTGIIAPVIEEIYFRGFLLSKMEWMETFAPLANAILFAFYHFWSPWQFVTRLIFLIPFCYISYKTKKLKLTIFVHCLLNIIGDGLGILFMIIQK